MVYRAWLGTVLLIAGCAPRVILSDEGASGTSETDASSEGGESSSSAVTTQPPMATVGPMGTVGPSSATFSTEGGFDSSGFFGSSGDFPSALCWSAQPLFEAPEESRLFVRDQDGDGLAELWLAFFEGGGGPGGGSELFWFDTNGQPNPGGFFPGFFTGFHNISGAQAQDAVGFAFDGGPPTLGFIEGIPLLVEGPIAPIPFGFQDGFEGFIDGNGDGLDDFLRDIGGLIEFQAGEGTGGFHPVSTIESGLLGDLAPQPVRGNAGLFAVAASSFFDELSACTFHPFELLAFSGDLIVSAAPSSQSSDNASTALIGAEHFGAFTNVYARACTDDGVTVQVQRFEGTEVTQVDDYESSSFVAFGDFDGNGQDDIGLGSTTLDSIRVYNGSVAGTFTESLFDEVSFGQPVPSRVFIVDIDSDGRDEIILGTRDGGSEIAYQRLDLSPC